MTDVWCAGPVETPSGELYCVCTVCGSRMESRGETWSSGPSALSGLVDEGGS